MWIAFELINILKRIATSPRSKWEVKVDEYPKKIFEKDTAKSCVIMPGPKQGAGNLAAFYIDKEALNKSNKLRFISYSI